MHRRGWTGSLLLHAALLLLLLRLQVPLPPEAPDYFDIGLFTAPPAPLPEQVSEDAPSRERAPPSASAAEAVPPDRSDLPRARIGVRSVPGWVSGPPPPPVRELDAGTLAGSSGPIRRAIASASDLEGARREASTIDTLLIAQRILAELAGEVLADARAAPKAQRGWGDPSPFPGSIQELRREPQMPLIPLAAAAAGALVELGRAAWERLTRREGALADGPDLDMTWEEAAAFGALREHHGVSIFEWHSRMPPDFEGDVSGLQAVAASLAQRGIVRLAVEGEVFRYRRVIPLADVIAYYTAFMSRLPDSERELRVGLERLLAVLVRVP